MTRPIPRILGFGLAMLVAACDDGSGVDAAGPGEPGYERDPSLDIELVSEADSEASHEVGQNCMQCHQPSGAAPGRFTAAGTIYDAQGRPNPNAEIELRGLDGSLVTAIAVDRLGNFYTTEPLPLPEVPVFPVVLENGGSASVAMPFPTSSASCNVCHTGADGVRLGS